MTTFQKFNASSNDEINERFVDNEVCEIQTFRDRSKHLRIMDKDGKFCRFERMVGDKGEVSLNFGKFKGLPLEDLDKGYVDWLINQEWCKPELKRTFEHLNKVGNLIV